MCALSSIDDKIHYIKENYKSNISLELCAMASSITVWSLLSSHNSNRYWPGSRKDPRPLDLDVGQDPEKAKSYEILYTLLIFSPLLGVQKLLAPHLYDKTNMGLGSVEDRSRILWSI